MPDDPEDVARATNTVDIAVILFPPDGEVPDELYPLANQYAALARKVVGKRQAEAIKHLTDSQVAGLWNGVMLESGSEVSYLAGELAKACLAFKERWPG